MPLMAEGKILPYPDIPFQHASPSVLKAMKRPGNQEKTLERIAAWRSIVPNIVLRSTFVGRLPGETEADFDFPLQWLGGGPARPPVEPSLYEDVKGAAANALPNHVPGRGQAEPPRTLHGRRLAHQPRQAEDPRRQDHGRAGRRGAAPTGWRWPAATPTRPRSTARCMWSPATPCEPGDLVKVRIERADAFDLYATPTDSRSRSAPAASPARRMHRVISAVRRG